MATDPLLQGFQELSKQLQDLGTEVRGKALRSAAMNAALPILRAAQANAPVNDRDYIKALWNGRRVAPGFLKRNIVRRAKVYQGGDYVFVMIGPTEEAYYGTQFVEVGTSNPYRPPQPWLVPAFEANREKALSNMKNRLKVLISKAVK